MKKVGLVFIPSPGIGHLVSTIEFANLLLERNEQLSIIVLVMKQGKEDITKLASHTNICFIELPHVEPPLIELRFKSGLKYRTDFIASLKTCVKDDIVKHVLPNSPKLFGLVVDLFCTSMIYVVSELAVPSYLFFTCSAAFLGFMLYLPHRHDRVGREFEESESESIIPGYINPVPANVLPSFAFNKEGGYISFVNHGRRFKETKGILVLNTFLDLESHAVSLLSTDNLPPIYTVGPLINHKNQKSMQSNNEGQHDEIIKWLDDQPPSSVVFLSYVLEAGAALVCPN